MTEFDSKHIICAVRGGAESRDTVTRAIRLAVESNGRLTFLHVMDAEFLHHSTDVTLIVVYNKLVEIGNIFLF